MLIEQLQDAGYQAQLTAKGRYMRGVLPLLGGQFKLSVLQNDAVLRLLGHATIRKGQSYSLAQLAQMAEPRAGVGEFRDHMANLVEGGAFIRGYRLKCPMCDLDTWYDLHAVDELTRCAGCQNTFQMPLTQPFAFRPNRLLSEALKSGMLTVLLTLNYWLQDAPVTMWQSNIQVARGGLNTDIDLLVLREDGLFLAECKDNFNVSEDGLQRLRAQLLLNQRIAHALGAEMVFATLYDPMPPREIVHFLEEYGIPLLDRMVLLGT